MERPRGVSRKTRRWIVAGLVAAWIAVALVVTASAGHRSPPGESPSKLCEAANPCVGGSSGVVVFR